jgi:hypothetical protein
MPLVAKGSLFAKLQSIAMGGVGIKTSLTGATIVSTVALQFLTDFCTIIDETDPSSPSGQIISSCEAAVTTADEVTTWASDTVGGFTTWASEMLDGATRWTSSQYKKFHIQRLKTRLDESNKHCQWGLQLRSLLHPDSIFRRYILSSYLFPCITEVEDLELQLAENEADLLQLTGG